MSDGFGSAFGALIVQDVVEDNIQESQNTEKNAGGGDGIPRRR